MAADTSATELAGRYRRLAALVEQLEADGYDVVDAEPTEDQHGRQHAEVQLNLDGGLDSEPFRADDLDEDENHETASITGTCNGDESERTGQVDPGPNPDDLEADEDRTETDDREISGDQQHVDVGGASADVDDGEADDEFNADAVAEDLQAESDTDDDADDDQPHPDEIESAAAEEPPADSLAAEVLATLREEGELSGPDLKTITGSRSQVYDALSELEDADLIEKRDDPDDGRRTLYSAADWVVDDEDQADDEPEWNGRDPEEIVADSSLPARVVLDDILDAVESASTLIEAAESLDVDIDNLEPVAWELTLKRPESYEVVDDVGDQVEKIREVAA